MKLYCVLIGLVCCVISLNAQTACSLKGELHLKGFSLHGEVFTTSERSFTVTIEGCRWNMALTDPGTNRNPDIVSWQIGSDGKDAFYVVQYDETPKRRTFYDPREGRTVARRQGLSPDAYVDPGVVLHHHSTLAAPIWLGLASGYYLSTNTTHRLRQTWEFDDENLEYTNFTLSAEWKLLGTSPQFPRRVVYHNSGTYYANSEGNSVSVPAPPPYDRGWTNAIYEVLSTTNIGNQTFPLTARFMRFAPKPGGKNPGDLAVITTIEIEVNTISTTEDEPLLPTLKPGVLVKDHRFHPEIQIPIAYQTDGHWLSREQVQKLPDFSVQMEIGKRPKAGAGPALPMLFR